MVLTPHKSKPSFFWYKKRVESLIEEIYNSDRAYNIIQMLIVQTAPPAAQRQEVFHVTCPKSSESCF